MNESMIQRIEEMGKKKFKRHVLNLTLPFITVNVGAKDMQRLIEMGYAKEVCNIPAPMGLFGDNGEFDVIAKDRLNPGDTILETLERNPNRYKEWSEDGGWTEVVEDTDDEGMPIPREEMLFIHKQLYLVNLCDSFMFYFQGGSFMGPSVTPELMLALDVLDVPFEFNRQYWSDAVSYYNTDYQDVVLSSGRGEWNEGEKERHLFLGGYTDFDTITVSKDHVEKLAVYFGEAFGQHFYELCGRMLIRSNCVDTGFHSAEQLWWIQSLGVEYHMENYWLMTEDW